MTIRHITVDSLGRIYEITNMFDRHSEPTEDPAAAVSVVIRQGDSHWEADAEHAPIYTVN
jgi:hypothetical protein